MVDKLLAEAGSDRARILMAQIYPPTWPISTA